MKNKIVARVMTLLGVADGNLSMVRNAAFLMASTAIMSVLGFGFWMFVAHLYAPEEIGEASALIAITLLISNLSFLGLNSAFVRFLPTSRNQSSDINAALLTVSVTTLIAGLLYLSFNPHFSGQLGMLFSTWWAKGGFLLALVCVSLNTLTDSVFIANRRAGFHTIAYAVFGVVRLLVPIGLIALGALGIFAAYVAAVVASLGLTFMFMRQAAGYRFRSRPNWGFIIRSRKYTSSNYIGSLLSGLPSQLIPTLIVLRLGPASAAYFSMAWTMANMLYVIPSATTNSLMAESSHNMAEKSNNLRHAVRILAVILVPVVAISILVAPFLLHLFGKEYAAGGTIIFQLLAVGTFFVAGNLVGNTILNLEHRSTKIVVVQLVIAASTMIAAYLFVGAGLLGIGLAMLLGNALGLFVQIVLLRSPAKSSADHEIAATSPDRFVILSLLKMYDLGDFSIGENIGNNDRCGTYLISSDRGKYVVKVYREDKRVLSDILAEIEYTQNLAEFGVPTPNIIAARDGRQVVQIGGDGTTWSGVLMNFEDGRIYEVPTEEAARNMAKIQARIHLHGQRYPLDTARLAITASPRRLWSRFLTWGARGVSHFDYDVENILFDENGSVVCVLDFEGMRNDRLLICLIYALHRLRVAGGDSRLAVAYVSGYLDQRRLSLFEKLLLRFMLAVRFAAPRMLVERF